MPNLQPLLVPCKGVLGDLHAYPDPADSSRLLIWWGTALLQAVPRDRESLAFRIVACLLLNLKFSVVAVARVLGVSRGTLRNWQEAFNAGRWEAVEGRFPGPGAAKKLRPDVEQYVRYRYRTACAENGGRMPYGFRQKLLKQLRECWPDQDPSGELVRQVFRDEDDETCATTAGQATAADGDTEAVSEVPEVRGPGPEHGTKKRKHACQNGLGEGGDPSISTTEGQGGYDTSTSSGLRPGNVKQACDCGPDGAPESRSASACLAVDAAPTPAELGKQYWPVLAPDRSPAPSLTPHAGLLLFAESFDRALGHLDPILRQTGAQILLGAVNQEQAKLVAGKALGQLIGKVVRDRDHQRTLLDNWLVDNDMLTVYQGNLQVAPLLPARNTALSASADNVIILYCDTHHEPYTGVEKLLLGWNNADKKVEESLALEYVHTENGQPLYAGHFDNFYDGRMRFLRMRDRLRALLGPEVKIVWVFDRGYWGIDFLARLANELGDGFIIWQKGYDGQGWNLPYEEEGHFPLTRQGNRADDERIVLNMSFRRQRWRPDTIPEGERLIVRVRRDCRESEVAVVCRCFGLAPRRVITTMFGRFGAQENDFSYGGRHFGYNELTSRAFDPYRDVADQFEDRQVDSRDYKATQKRRDELRKQVARELFALDGMPSVSLAQLDARARQLHKRRDRLSEQLAARDEDGEYDKLIRRLRRGVDALVDAFSGLDRQRQQAEQRGLRQQQCEELRTELEQVEEQLRQTAKTESRLAALIEERYVYPDMRRKALVDALRITSRNVFADVFGEFRACCDNYRDDHQVLRALTQAPGLIVPHPGGLDVYLIPALDRQPAQWRRIDTFLASRQDRIEPRFGLAVRFHVQASSPRMLAAAWRAQQRARSP